MVASKELNASNIVNGKCEENSSPFSNGGVKS